ncbi:Hypothetical protein PHPALM_14328 [Phytophthora palmivora]|uniref:Uncharacterized protein n=1 Tax=Phytophthora palmivora TaxID=4796 RepID=A0A2P4XV88_9STRA|nr:Hypothetical protein PHPALM_14328 [Phytophthora palmivora]
MHCMSAGILYSKAKWRRFWGYFARTWLEHYDVEVWNAHGLSNELIAHTNNPLEMLNRELNNRIPTHPSMTTFVSVIKTLSAEYDRRVADVPRGRVRRKSREAIVLPDTAEIPEDIKDDSDGDELVCVEQVSDDSSDEEQVTPSVLSRTY